MGQKKKILIFVDWFLPGYKAGGPVQSCAALIEHLGDEFDFSVVTRDTDYCESKPYPLVKCNEWNDVNGTPVFYFSRDFLSVKAVRNLLSSREYDGIYLNGIFSLYFTIIPLLYLRKKRMPVIIAARGMFGEGALGIKKMKKRMFLEAARVAGLFRNVLFHATNLAEAEDIRRELGDVKIKVAGNFPRKHGHTVVRRIKKAGHVRLLSLSRIAREKNILFAVEVLKDVQGIVEFDLFGPCYDEAYWKECLPALRSLPPGVTASYKGTVENISVPSLLGGYHFLLMPTLGENFGHVVIEAMSAGCPVIISDRTMWNKLNEQQAGWDLPLSKNAFREVIQKCVEMEQEEYDKLSAGALRYADAFSNDPALLSQNRDLFSS